MDGRLIFLHHGVKVEARQDAGVKGERPARRGRPARARAYTIPKSSGSDRQEKPTRGRQSVPVLKLTQVGEMKILRRSRERS